MYQKKFPHGIMFHRFKNSKDKNTIKGTLTAKNLTDIINFIGRERILNPNEWIDKLNKGNLSKKDVCLTFDDGLKSQIKIALPILDKFKIKAFWFIHSKISKNNFDKSEIFSMLIVKKFKNYIKFSDKFLKYIKLDANVFKSKEFIHYYNEENNLYNFYSKTELKCKFIRDIYFSKKKIEIILENFFKIYKLNIKDFSKNIWLNKKDILKLEKKGHLIGMHSHTHPYRMKLLSPKAQKIEYNKNFKFLKLILKKKPIAMAHPIDSYNKSTLKILKNLKILCGFRSHMKPSKGSKINPSNLEFAREDPTNIMKVLCLKK